MPGGLALSVLAVGGFLAVVAVVSRSARPGGTLGGPSIDARSISVNVLFPFIVVAGIAASLVAVSVRRRRRGGGYRPRTMASLLSDVFAFVLFLVFVRLVVWLLNRRSGDDGDVLNPNALVNPSARPVSGDGAAATGDWRIQLVVALGTAIALGLIAYRLSRYAGREEPRIPGTPTEDLADVIDEGLAALRAERDPRRAVIAAYARMERALGAAGLPRHPSEAPAEYLSRVLAAMRVGEEPVARLTGLYERAKFDRRTVDEDMREQAIRSLIAIREQLMAAVS